MAGYGQSSRRLRQRKPHSGGGAEAGESAGHLFASRTFRRARYPNQRFVCITGRRAADSLTLTRATHRSFLQGGAAQEGTGMFGWPERFRIRLVLERGNKRMKRIVSVFLITFVPLNPCLPEQSAFRGVKFADAKGKKADS